MDQNFVNTSHVRVNSHLIDQSAPVYFPGFRSKLSSIRMDRQQLRGIIVAFLVTSIILIHYVEQESKLRRDNILTMYLLRRRAIRTHFKRKGALWFLNGVDVLTRIHHQRAIRYVHGVFIKQRPKNKKSSCLMVVY